MDNFKPDINLIEGELVQFGWNTSKFFTINLLLIIFFDSYAVYGSIPIIKMLIYGLKLVNVFGLIYLLQVNTLKKYLLLLVYFPIWWFYFNEENFLLSLQLLFSGILPVFTFLLLKEAEQKYLARLFIKLIYYLCLIGIPIYLLINFVGISPLFSIQRGEVGIGRVYDNYLLFYWSRPGVNVRFSSVFDEPGVLGTIIPFIFLYYRDKLTKREFWVLFISGFLTMSLFYMIVIIPVLYFGRFRNTSRFKQLIKTALFFIVVVMSYIGLVLFARTTKENRLLSLKVYYRFEWENDWIVGIVNNREGFNPHFQQIYEEWNNPSELSFYIGKGKDYVLNEVGGTLSYRVALIERGVIIVIYLFLFIIALHNWRRYTIFSFVSMVFISLTFFQRPGIWGVNYLMLMYTGIYLYKDNIKIEGMESRGIE